MVYNFGDRILLIGFHSDIDEEYWLMRGIKKGDILVVLDNYHNGENDVNVGRDRKIYCGTLLKDRDIFRKLENDSNCSKILIKE